MKTLKRLIVTTVPPTSSLKKEVEQSRQVCLIENQLDVVDEYLEVPNLFDSIEVIDGYLSDAWIKRALNKLGYHWVHLDLSDEDWKLLKLNSNLYGRSHYVNGQAVTYGRWHERSRYQQSHRYPEPYNKLTEKALGIWHEGDHAFRGMFGLNTALTHYFFYGYDRIYTVAEETKLKPRRWVQTPHPDIGWRSMPWGRLPDIETKKPEPVIDFGVALTKRHPANLDQYSWAGNEPRAIVFHTLLGTLDGSLSWLEQINLSYHFLIDLDGKIYEHIPLGRSAWHAGRWNEPTERARTFFKNNPNRESIGIAFADREGNMVYQNLNDAQIASAVALVKQIGQQTGVRYTEDNTFAHKEIAVDKPAKVEGYRQAILAGLDGERGIIEKQEQVISLAQQVIALLKALLKRENK